MNYFTILSLIFIKNENIFCKFIPFSFRSRIEVCEFPSIYKDKVINQCQLNRSGGYWWCPNDDNFDLHSQKTICPNTSLTYAGSDPGKFCKIPFIYKQKVYYACIRSIDEVNYKVYWWCATTVDYDNDKRHRWTRCNENSDQLPCHFSNVSDSSATGINSECRLFYNKWVCNTERKEIRECPKTDTTFAGNSPGDKCHFPFLFGHSEYRSCISAKRTDSVHYRDASQFEPYLWCATTANYNIDQKWTKCISEESVLRWSDKRVLIPVLVVLGILGLVLLLAGLLYFFCEGGRQNKRDIWGQQSQYISHPVNVNHHPATPTAPPSYHEAVMSLTNSI